MQMTAAEVRAMVVAEAARMGSQSALADKVGLSKPYLSDVCAGKREAGQKLLDFFGVEKRAERVVRYFRKEEGK